MCTTENNGNNRKSNSSGGTSTSMSLAPNRADSERTPTSKAADRGIDNSDILSNNTAHSMIEIPRNDSREDYSIDNSLEDDSKENKKIARSSGLGKERSHALVRSPPRAILLPPPGALVQNIVNVVHNMMGRNKRERSFLEDGEKEMMHGMRGKRRKCTHGDPVRIVPESKTCFYKVMSGGWFDKWRDQQDIVAKAQVAAEKKREIANEKAYMKPAADRAEMEVHNQVSWQNEMFDGFARAALTNILSETRNSRGTVEEDMLKEMKERDSIDKMEFMSNMGDAVVVVRRFSCEEGQYDPVRVGSRLFKAERHLHRQSKYLDEASSPDVENHASDWASSSQDVSLPSAEQAAKGSTQLHDETVESREELQRVLEKTTEELDATLIEVAKLDAFEDTVEYGRKLLDEREQAGKETSLRTFTRALKERCRRRQELLNLVEL